MSCIDWTQSSIRHREEGAAVLFPSSRVVIADYHAVSARQDLARSSVPPPSLYPVLSEMFSHSCKGRWQCFLNLC